MRLGNIELNVPRANTLAEPVSILSQKITEKVTTWLLSVEKSCPAQIKTKGFIQADSVFFEADSVFGEADDEFSGADDDFPIFKYKYNFN